MDRTSDTSHLVTKPPQRNGGCSCTACNSFDCFELRRNPQEASDRCTCYKCLNFQTCLFYNKPKSAPDTTLTTIYNASDIQNEIKPETKWIEKTERENDIKVKNYILLCKEIMEHEKTKLMLSKNNELSTIPNTESTVKRHCPKSNVNASESKFICSKRKEYTQYTNKPKEIVYSTERQDPEVLCKQKLTKIDTDCVLKKKGSEIQQNHHHHHHQKERETKSDYICTKSKESQISCKLKTTEVSSDNVCTKKLDFDNQYNYKHTEFKPMYVCPKRKYSEMSWNQKETETSPEYFSFKKKESEMSYPQNKRELKSEYVCPKTKTCKTDKTVKKDNPKIEAEITPANLKLQGQKHDHKSHKSHLIKKIASADCCNVLRFTPGHTIERTKVKVCPIFCPICNDFLCEDQNAVRATSKTKVCPRGCLTCLQAKTKVSLHKCNTCHQDISNNKPCINKCPNYSRILSKTEICRKTCIKCRHSSSKTKVYRKEHHLDYQEATSLASKKNDTCVSSQYLKCTKDKQDCPIKKDEFENLLTDCHTATDSQKPSFKRSKTTANIYKDSLCPAVGGYVLKNRVCSSKCNLNKNIILLECCKDVETKTCNNEQTNKTEISESCKRKRQQECNYNNKSKIADVFTENIRNPKQKLKSRKTDINICCPNLNHKIGYSKIYDIFPAEKIVICHENACKTKSNTNKTISGNDLKIQDSQELKALIKECVGLEIRNSIRKKIYNAEKNSKYVHCTASTINQETKPTTDNFELKVDNHFSPVNYYEKIKSFICQELMDTFSRPEVDGSFSARSDIKITELKDTISASSLKKHRDFGLLAFIKGFIHTEIHNYDSSKIDKNCKSVDCTVSLKTEPNTRQLEKEVEKKVSPINCNEKLKIVCQELKDSFISKSNVSILSIKTHGEIEIRSSNKILQENGESECVMLQKTDQEIDILDFKNRYFESPAFKSRDKSIEKLKIGKRKEQKPEKIKENKKFPLKKSTLNTYNNSVDGINTQIEIIPFKKIKTITQPETKLKSQNDLLTKIRRIYKACNCKVCECISSPTKVKSEMCNCKPCDCAECRGESLDHDNRVKKSNYKAMLRSYSDKCQCRPCGCIECNEKNLKSCKCERCECTTCESLGMKKQTNFIVAQFGENLQRPYCQCSSCGCFECTNPLGAPTHNTQQTGTDTRRHVNCDCDNCINDLCEQEGIDTCSCDRAKQLMRKPVTRDKNDYDIHYFINKKKPDSKYFKNVYKRHTPVPIYTSLTQHLIYPSKMLTCCSFQIASNSNYARLARNVNLSIIPQDYWTLRTQADLITNSINECNCKPCECLKCRKHFLEGHIPYRHGWSCEICECINCATLSLFKEIEKEYNQTDNSSRQKCNCKPCMCEHCAKYIITSMHGDSTMNQSAYVPSQQQQKSNSDHLLTLLSASDSERFIELVLSDKETKNIGVIKNKSMLFGKQPLNENDNFKHSCANIIKNKYQVYCNEGLTNVNKKIETLKQRDSKLEDSKNFKDLEYFPRTVSLTLSNEMSFDSEHKKKIVSEIPKKSQTGSSCNSSGHDYSDYLIRFPTSTANSCINDVMSLLYNKPDKAYSKLSLTSTPVKGPLSNSSINTLKQLKKPLLFDVSPKDTFQQNYAGKNCKNENSEKSCDCSPCGCEKCTYKMPKLKRCRCDCFACKCDGTCLSEDRSVLIRKNETTQTSKSAPDCGSAFKTSVLSKNLPLLKFKMSNITLNRNSAVLNNRIVKWTDRPGHNFGYNSTNVSVMHEFHTINYESVRRTIREAKQFSLELLSILRKYEKANKDLDIMTERYRSLHAPVLKADNKKIQYLKQPNNYLTYIETAPHYRSVMQFDKIPDKIEFEKGILKSTKMEKNNDVNDTEEGNTSISEICFKDTTREQCNETKYIIHENLEKYKNNANLNSKEMCNQVETKQKSPFRIEEFFKHAEQNTSDLFVIENTENTCERNEWINKKTNSSVSQVSGDNITVNKNTRPSLKFRGFSYQVPQIKELINKNSNSDLNTDVIHQSQKNHAAFHNDEVTQHILNMEQLDSSNKIVVQAKAELDVVEVAKESRSTQSYSTRNVQSQAKFIKLNSSTSRLGSRRSSGLRNTVESDTASAAESYKSGQDQLRVVFQTVRKVSDHSILIKWKIPEDITDVKGYEILVDGRSIQMILNPNKNMAVITCLPHAEKVKLTVRTVVKSAPGHTPSASVSYCNRTVSSLRRIEPSIMMY